ncbi:hypothetical protein [Candidatus Pseudomonas adelgestsugas]|nr:hypothetical protein [Candidatus Pseudomonas adelgestsugas]
MNYLSLALTPNLKLPRTKTLQTSANVEAAGVIDIHLYKLLPSNGVLCKHVRFTTKTLYTIMNDSVQIQTVKDTY